MSFGSKWCHIYGHIVCHYSLPFKKGLVRGGATKKMKVVQGLDLGACSKKGLADPRSNDINMEVSSTSSMSVSGSSPQEQFKDAEFSS